METTLVRGRLYGGECCFLALKEIIRGLLVSIHLKENLPIVNIKSTHYI